jgi:hypothetical protein
MRKLFHGTLIFGFVLVLLAACSPLEKETLIDRKALVNRNNVVVEGFDSLASLSVGNGNFAFTTDLTGLQTFYKEYENGVPLGTQSNWGWHSVPNEANYRMDETLKYFEVEGRQVPYRHQLKSNPRAEAACNYFRANPHRLHLGIIALWLVDEKGETAALEDIKNATHHLDLWSGKITSSFEFDGHPVQVEVFAHQDVDLLSVRIQSPLITLHRLGVEWKFPYAKAEHSHPGYDFTSLEKHQTLMKTIAENRVVLERRLDTTRYQVAIQWKGSGQLTAEGAHHFRLLDGGDDVLEFSTLFAPSEVPEVLPVFDETAQNNELAWLDYWSNGGMVDFSECTDPRARELERRVVLSQYLTKIQSTGTLPPAETGLTYNSWFGKFHLEMHWWHVAHFAQWQRPQLIQPQLDYYFSLLDVARQTAADQGYEGVRWPKMIGPEGENSPSSIGSYLIWQQPHIIWLAEQQFRARHDSAVLHRYAGLVFESARFMADFPVWNDNEGVYDLQAPLIPAQEHWDVESTVNPPFELAYWYWGLSTAQEWRKRLGLEPDEQWEEVRMKLAAPDQANGVYLGIEGASDSYKDPELMRDHPMVLGAYGILPEWDQIDPDIMRFTMHTIAKRWNWQATWGWDYPMSAMAAVRLNEPDMALDFLLKDVQKNTYLKNGHNYQDERLRIYLPGNGGLLQTVAMMCAGWEGCESTNPGFPDNGKWKVKWENISPVF